MNELTTREKILLSLMAVAVTLTLFYFTGQLLNQRKHDLQTNLTQTINYLDQAKTLAREWKYLAEIKTPPVNSMALVTQVERVADQLGLRENLQLNALSANVPPGMEGLRVTLDKVNLDQAIEILYQIENNKPVLLVNNLDMGKIPGSTLLRLSFLIFKQKPNQS